MSRLGYGTLKNVSITQHVEVDAGLRGTKRGNHCNTIIGSGGALPQPRTIGYTVYMEQTTNGSFTSGELGTAGVGVPV